MEKKWNLQDIKPAERRRPSVRPSAPKKREESAAVAADYQSETLPERRPRPAREERPKSKKGVFIGGAILLVILVVGFVSAILTSGAQVTVFPRLREPTVNTLVEAKRAAASNELPYEILTLEAEGERQVSATGQEDVKTQAVGTITIKNTSSESQRLITNTRFQTEGGLLFRIKDSAVVPAANGATPGSINAEVFADQPGEKYNLPAGTKFKAPGLESNADLYNAISAENQADITGGYEGPRFIIEDEELAAATESLQSELRQALLGRIDAERPAGFLLFNSAVSFVYRDLPPVEVGGGSVKLKQKAILQVPIFKSEDFASFIAVTTVPGYEGEAVRIEGDPTFNFEYAGEVSDLAALDSISFRLTGKPKLVWVFDQEQLKKDLAGGAQTALNTVLGGYPAIEKATATIRPFWKRSFPDNPADISIVENLEGN